MSRLTKGMYKDETRDGLFGLRLGQLRGNQLVHDGGWYNERGEKLGWGDLSPEDFTRIRGELDDDEFFIILGEQDSYWSFVKKTSSGRGMIEVRPEIEAPGVNYVAGKCRYIITKNTLYFVSNDPSDEDTATIKMGLPFRVMTRKEARKFFAGSFMRCLRRIAGRFLNTSR